MFRISISQDSSFQHLTHPLPRNFRPVSLRLTLTRDRSLSLSHITTPIQSIKIVKMKSSLLTVFGLVAAAAAQSSGDLPQCGQTCAGNMVSAAKSKELGCDAGDVSCLCTNQDFIYGLRDCSAAICNSEQAAAVVAYGLALCRQAGVQITTGSAGSVSASATGTGAVRTVLSTLVESDTTITSAVSTISGTATGGNEDDLSVSTYTSVFTNSAGDEVTSTIKEILGGVALTTYTSGGSTIIEPIETASASASASASDETESAQVTTFTTDGTAVVRTLTTVTTGSETDSADTAEVTTFTTDGTEVVRTLTTVTTGSESESGSVSETVTDASTVTEGSGTATGTEASASASSTETDNAAVAQMTGAPMGVIAAAGLAMLLL
ncbi:unnamed protein product [Fusarium graminearum]|uniref:Chromosome 3, complete genome n=2 Tax=Gibberella zeae (strain ATCC MYA-4620 / CBS 123657 / FGSC 9075 / NRRL 31084 / PH-1) TaxID=229533 RepID=A0A098DY67_GIBZE|nr:unnamed protein product [Fusarium graminearum]